MAEIPCEVKAPAALKAGVGTAQKNTALLPGFGRLTLSVTLFRRGQMEEEGGTSPVGIFLLSEDPGKE